MDTFNEILELDLNFLRKKIIIRERKKNTIKHTKNAKVQKTWIQPLSNFLPPAGMDEACPTAPRQTLFGPSWDSQARGLQGAHWQGTELFARGQV